MHSNALKDWPQYSHSKNFCLKQLLKSFVTKALLKMVCMYCYAFLSDKSLFTLLPFDNIVYL